MKKKFLICILSIFLFSAYGQIVDPYGEHHEEPLYLKEELFCNHTNYKEFIFDPDKMLELRDQGKTCQLGGGKFVNEDFRGAVLVGVNFEGSKFRFVHFEGANLYDANMRNTGHWVSYFNDSGDEKTILVETDFTGSTCVNCEFKNSEMMKAILVKTVLISIKMSGADVTGADFTNVTISGWDDIDYGSIRGLDQIICSQSTRHCKALRACSDPNNIYC